MNLFWSIKNSNEVVNKFKSKGFKNSKLSTYDFFTLYTTLPHKLIKDILTDLIERTFSLEKTKTTKKTTTTTTTTTTKKTNKQNLYLACNEALAFFTSDVHKNYNLWSCQEVCEALVYNIFIRFETKFYMQTIDIPMGTSCVPLVADLFLCSYERDFMKSF